MDNKFDLIKLNNKFNKICVLMDFCIKIST